MSAGWEMWNSNIAADGKLTELGSSLKELCVHVRMRMYFVGVSPPVTSCDTDLAAYIVLPAEPWQSHLVPVEGFPRKHTGFAVD